jgi:hypothetical protein
VAGEVIGAVTSAGGSASIVADNLSQDSSVDTGDADASNDASAFVGLAATLSGDVDLADVNNACPNNGAQAAACENVQDGSNSASNAQTATASSGDGVAGQVIGAVSAGATSIDARNRSIDDDVTTGNADASNDASAFVGLAATGSGNVDLADVNNACVNNGAQAASCQNVQDGSNRVSNAQTASATSGDAVAGQVTGAVTSAGGSASIVVDNTSQGIDSESGDSNFDNSDQFFVGLVASGLLTI